MDNAICEQLGLVVLATRILREAGLSPDDTTQLFEVTDKMIKNRVESKTERFTRELAHFKWVLTIFMGFVGLVLTVLTIMIAMKS
ncbi:MAG: hypothetical protein OXL40_04810 [Bacteroidota bacterium]|nr:hypothetical protein [Bacteroidota bacterium]